MARLPVTRPPRPMPAATIIRSAAGAPPASAPLPAPPPRQLWRPLTPQPDPMRTAEIRANMAVAEHRLAREEEAAGRAAFAARLEAEREPDPGPPAWLDAWQGEDDEPIRQEVLDVSPAMLEGHVREADAWSD